GTEAEGPPPEPDGEEPPEETPEAAPQGEGEGEKTEVDDGAPTVAKVAGRYEIDVDAFFEAMEAALRKKFEENPGDLPPDVLDGTLEMLRDQFGGLEFELVLDIDLTFTVEAVMAEETTEGEGTWTLEGDGVTLTQTEENGESLDEPQVLEGTWKDGTLRLKPDGETAPFEQVLHRQDGE
ncbi:MAG: hypothetical protein ACC662_09600, partial [Planctomycetota bacterium]